MNKNTLFEIVLFDPENTLIALLEKQDIKFQKIGKSQKFVVATDETIEIVSRENNDILIESLVSIFMTWLNKKPHRKLQAQLVDGSILYIDKYDSKGNTDIINRLLKVNAFDPEYNTRIINR
jgi:hypothetical protein